MEGGGGVQEPLILADIICEQPLITIKQTTITMFVQGLGDEIHGLRRRKNFIEKIHGLKTSPSL